MNDRFRFRAWDNKNKNFIFDIEDENKRDWEITELEQCRYFGEYLYMPDRYIVEQGTGLKDKNGRLIYEGDILKGSNGSVNGSLCEFIGVVSWLKQKARFDLPVWAYDKDGNYSDDWSHWFEVIGNIHENPERLEGGK